MSYLISMCRPPFLLDEMLINNFHPFLRISLMTFISRESFDVIRKKRSHRTAYLDTHSQANNTCTIMRSGQMNPLYGFLQSTESNRSCTIESHHCGKDKHRFRMNDFYLHIEVFH